MVTPSIASAILSLYQCDVYRVTCDVDAHRSLEVAGSVFWGSLGAVKQLFGAQSSLQEEKLQQ
jgi:hypothetical protein